MTIRTNCRGAIRIRQAAGPSMVTARLLRGLEVQSHVRQRTAYKRSSGSARQTTSIVHEAAERLVNRSTSERRVGHTRITSQEVCYSVQRTATKGAPITKHLFLIYRLVSRTCDHASFPPGTLTRHRLLPWALLLPSVHRAAAKLASPNLTAESSPQAAHW